MYFLTRPKCREYNEIKITYNCKSIFAEYSIMLGKIMIITATLRIQLIIEILKSPMYEYIL